MAKKVYKCVFSSVNGENTGVFTRTQMTKNSPSPGILYKKNCPDGLHFYADPDVGGTNNYYKLIDPGKYKGINTSSGTVYVWLSKTYLTSWTLVDDPSAPAPAPAPVVQPATPPIDPKQLSTGTAQSSIIGKAIDTSIYNSKGVSLNEPIKKFVSDDSVQYVSYTGKTSSALTPKQKWNSYKVANNYFMDYSSMIADINTIEKNLNIGISPESAKTIKNDMINKFNRFLTAFPDTELSKTFAHVFFTRPDLNLYKDNGAGLLDRVDNDPYFYYLNRNSPELLKSLTSNFSNKHSFNPYLSNRAGSFELKDEYIDTNEYGETFTGWKIKYGKHNNKSKTADSFSITYTDDSNCNVLKIHKAWVDYISKVYRGEFSPNSRNVRSRTIDYASSVYYFLCGPDGETLLFWTKYTGVFPTTIPANGLAWSKGNVTKLPEYSINYEYSWKEDMVPTTLAEFNINSAKQSSYQYAKIFEPEIASTGKTFVNAPFIETVIDKVTGKYEYKLKFRP